jgi:nicotinamide-nucleotide amidase
LSEAQVTRLARRLGEACRRRGPLLVATAESCTGGGVAEAITRIPGSSAWFDRGFVTYTNAAKSELLGVPEAIIAGHGAVSEAVAVAMVDGALARSSARVAVSITGIAGPGGGTAAKPVGLVCFAWAARGQVAQPRTLRLKGDRAEIRRQSVAIALQGLLQLLR